VENKIRKSLACNFSSFADKSCSLEKFAEIITLETLEYANDDYLKYCLYETMRIEPPVPLSSGFTLTEPVDIGNYHIRAGDLMFANIKKLHHLEEQWGGDHDQYRPERFSERAKHHPMSYMPFLAGKRVCAGKTFAENSMKVVYPIIMKAFARFEFVDQQLYKVKPANSVVMKNRPEIIIKLTEEK
jgi:cytochrome P450 / NADPH-cytochrome P450 reductase